MKQTSRDLIRLRATNTSRSAILPRVIAGLLALMLLGLILSMASFRLEEINWQSLNPLADPQQPNGENSNLLGILGLYSAGIFFHLCGAASWWIVILFLYFPVRLISQPQDTPVKQLICIQLLIITSCSIMAIQPWLLREWAQSHASWGPGGLIGELVGHGFILTLTSLGIALSCLIFIHALALIYYSDSGVRQVARFFYQDCLKMGRYVRGQKAQSHADTLQAKQNSPSDANGSHQPSRSNPIPVSTPEEELATPRKGRKKQSKQHIPTARNRGEKGPELPPTLAPHHKLSNPTLDEDESPVPPRSYERPSTSSTPTTSSQREESSAPESYETQVLAHPPAILPTHRVIAAADMSHYRFPELTILHYEPISAELDAEAQQEMQQMQGLLLDTLSSFGYEVDPGDITRGPSITRYEIYPARGLRINRITALRKDLMLATSSESINIIAPIPGKNSIGIELANEVKSPVYLRELLQDELFLSDKYRIPVALGKDVYGKTVIGDLASMPHTLVAGTTGSGKSVCINCMIISMLYKFTPEDLKLVLIDPKTVEMQPYLRIPHLACPVVTEPARAIGALRWAVNEMEHRYRLFSRFGVRNFEDYNACSKEFVPDEDDYWGQQDNASVDRESVEALADELERQAASGIPLEEEDHEELELDALEDVPEKLPYIVIIIDELADLMMIVKEDLENYVARLTQKARAAGIHLVVATQTPRSNVVTGIIKANIPSRIAFKVSSPLDSRIILDMDGADNLLGRGDCLFMPPTGIVGLTRAQGAFVSDKEIQQVVAHCATQVRQRFVKSATAELNNCASAANNSGKGGGSPVSEEAVLDELYDRCVEMVIRERKASTSMIQRRFRVGYARAGRIMDTLEKNGVVSAPRGSKSERDILIDAPDGENGENE